MKRVKGGTAEEKARQKVEKAQQQAQKKVEKVQQQAEKQRVRAEQQAQKKAANAEKKANRALQKAEKKAKDAVRRAEKEAAKAEKKRSEAAKAMEANEANEAAEGGKKKKDKKGGKKILLLIPILAVVAAAGVFAFLKLRGEKEPEEPVPIEAPLMYQVGQTQVSALPAWGEVLVYQEEIDPAEYAPKEKEESQPLSASVPSGQEGEGGQEEGQEENAQEEQPQEEEEEIVITAVRYRYEGYTAPSALAGAYAAMMTTEDAGFSFVDEKLYRGEGPDFEASRGSAHLARNAIAEEDEGKVLSIKLDWTAEKCTVTVDTLDGRVTDPPPPPGEGGGAAAGSVMSTMDALDFFRGLEPSALGLQGSSMEEYNVYALDGTVKVDDIPCMRMNVYREGEGDANIIAGSYFLSLDGTHVYRLDPAANTVKELDTAG